MSFKDKLDAVLAAIESGDHNRIEEARSALDNATKESRARLDQNIAAIREEGARVQRRFNELR